MQILTIPLKQDVWKQLVDIRYHWCVLFFPPSAFAPLLSFIVLRKFNKSWRWPVELKWDQMIIFFFNYFQSETRASVKWVEHLWWDAPLNKQGLEETQCINSSSGIWMIGIVHMCPCVGVWVLIPHNRFKIWLVLMLRLKSRESHWWDTVCGYITLAEYRSSRTAPCFLSCNKRCLQGSWTYATAGIQAVFLVLHCFVSFVKLKNVMSAWCSCSCLCWHFILASKGARIVLIWASHAKRVHPFSFQLAYPSIFPLLTLLYECHPHIPPNT